MNLELTKTKNQRRIVIGDVHGQYQALIKLLEALNLTDLDEVYFLGDLIDRGPDSSKVVTLVIDNNYNCLLGNHEDMLLTAVGNGKLNRDNFHAWLYSGGYATLESYKNNIPQKHLDWFKQLPLYFDLGDFWLVHAGIEPSLPISKQSSNQFCWIRREFHATTKPYFPNKLIITGHTITFTFPGVKPGQIAKGAGWIGIETGAYHPKSGWLTALDLDNEIVHQINTLEDYDNYRCLPLNEAIANIDLSKIISKNSKA